MDIGSAVGRAVGISDQQILDINHFEESDAFTEDEKLVLRWAVCLSAETISIPDELRAAIEARFSRAEQVELAAAIAWEHHRSRLNKALGIRAMGFSEGAVCVLPARPKDAA